ncbi:hypothetical protein [Zobellia uliginosa]|uniref:hypothetical protein n=1 Tax=Zobellia uliginosa TaxID=143224 RepID=UPI0026E1A650|nr:hypothetical protein [Zobellia uliginosa]MDO6518557.1 hypothetical protein [Zobellia uliginosa]
MLSASDTINYGTMKYTYITLLFLSLVLYSSGNKTSQETFVTPSTYIDSIFTAVKNNDFKKFRRQFDSRELKKANRLKTLGNLNEVQEKFILYVDDHEKGLVQNYNSLRDTINKYGLSRDRQYHNRFVYVNRLDKTHKRVEYAKSVDFSFLKDSVILTFTPFHYELHKTDTHWVSKNKLEVKRYPVQEISKRTPYFVNTIPEDFIAYGEKIYTLIKNRNLEDLKLEYPQKDEFGLLNTSEESLEKLPRYLQENHVKLEKEFDTFTIVESLYRERTSVLWKKKNYRNEGNMRVTLYVKTTKGDRLINIICMPTEKRIMLDHISTKLITP